MGEVLPGVEDCTTIEDEDCDGAAPACPVCPVAHWSLDESAGFRDDDSGNELYLEELGAPVGVEPVGTIGGGAAFAPGSGILGIPPSRFQGSPLDLKEPPLTLAAWIRLDAPTTGVIMSRERPCLGQVFGLSVDSALGLDAGFGGLPAPVIAPSAVSVGLWQHVAVAFDGALVTFYVNGVVVQSKPLNLTTLENPVVGAEFGFTLGGRVDVNDECNPDYQWTGAIDDAAVYASALTTAEVQAIMGGATCL